MQYQEARKNLKNAIRRKKQLYADRIKEQMESNNTKEVFNGIKCLLNIVGKKNEGVTKEFGENLNEFYTRFEDDNLKEKRTQCKEMLIAKKHQQPDRFIEYSIDEDDVEKELKRVIVRKSKGPDGVLPITLKHCSNNLKKPLTQLFNWVLRECHYPLVWKLGEIIPVPKVPCPKALNDFRPVTLTSAIAKVFERIVQEIIKKQISHNLDTFQFAYKSNSSTVDAIVTLLHTVTKHLDKSSTNYARCLFIDYQSAFNTIQPHMLIDMLMEKNVSYNICLLIFSFLDQRQQFVRTRDGPTDVRYTCTGSPQGCVMSAFLFTIYTDKLRSAAPNISILKYADDTVVLGLIHGNSEKNDVETYANQVNMIVTWGEEHYLKINETKTKEMMIDFRKSSKTSPPRLSIKQKEIELVSNYKYLGLHIDSKLNFDHHIALTEKKASKRMFLIKKLKAAGVDMKLVKIAFQAYVEPIVFYSSSAWLSLLTNKNKRKLLWSHRRAADMGLCEKTRADILERKCLQGLREKILIETKHPLHKDLTEQKSNGRNKWKMLFCRTNRYRSSFIPQTLMTWSNTV